MIGKTLVHYEITAEIGRGGMGEVYQAKDTKLGRDVAIKVLPEEFALDSDRVARFQREAKLLASLNHPNIAAIYGLEESDGTHFLVMELIEGDTLKDRIKSGPIPVEEALKLALQMAEALEAAHEKGVIHRDLKPANIKVTPDGKVKVLDFGLAKAYAGDQENISPLDSPTLSAAATQQGVILGTAAYMSPEQARGKPVDKRADVWAFGCVLFEMLTGQTAFQGEDVSETLASVIKGDSNLALLPANIHPRIREVIIRCLQKDMRKRYSGIGDARYEIEQALSDPSGVFAQPTSTIEPRRNLRSTLTLIAATFILTAIIVGAAVWYLKTSESGKVMRYDYELPLNHQFVNLYPPLLAVSPDGTQFVYSTTEGLYIKAEDELNAKFIVGTDELTVAPFFSPDGQWIGYHSMTDQMLKKISINGGAPESLCPVITSTGPSWGEDDMILYSEFGGSPIMRISANGGKPEVVVEADGQFLYPQIMPDCKTVMFTQRVENICHVVVQSIETAERKVLFPGHSARYIPTGHIVYAIGNNLFAVVFDLDDLKVLGSEILVLEGLLNNPDGSIVQYAVSDSGTLVYIPGIVSEVIKNTLVWVTRDGKEEPLGTPVGRYYMPKISPDGKSVALCVAGENTDIKVLDLERNNFMRLTLDESMDIAPIWTLDGKRIVYHSSGKKMGIYWKNADGTGQTELLISERDRALYPYSWSSDGKTLVMGDTQDAVTKYDISILLMEGERTRKPLLQEDYLEMMPKISPDGKWIAYCSNESGENEIFVRPFPDVDKGKHQVSTTGGFAPIWASDGKELFYMNVIENEVVVMAVKVETEPGFKPSSPKPLFQGAYGGPSCPWDIHPDGKKFLMIKNLSPISPESTSADRPKIIVVKNWFEELKQRVPVD